MTRSSAFGRAVLLSLLLVLLTAGAAEAARHPHVSWFPRGQCTRWAYIQRPDIVETAIRRHVRARTWAARAWARNAKAAGLPVGGRPRRGDIAVWGANRRNPTGHVAYVESVRPSGRIRVSELNFNGSGRMTKRTIAPRGWRSARFIHRR